MSFHVNPLPTSAVNKNKSPLAKDDVGKAIPVVQVAPSTPSAPSEPFEPFEPAAPVGPITLVCLTHFVPED